MSPKTLFDTHVVPVADKMYRYAVSILKEGDVAHDVVQECMAKIWSHRQKLSDIRNVEAWAMRIARNQCYDWVRANRFTVLSDKEMQQTDMTEADHHLLVNDQLNWLEKAIQTLPEKQQEIYHLREVEEMTYQDIAEILSLSLSEVKVYLHRARIRIKSYIQKVDAYGVANG